MASANQKFVLVTGGCGFMGSHFVRLLYKKYPNYTIVNLDLLTYAGNQENLKDVDECEKALPEDERRYIEVVGDVCDEKLVNNLFNEYNFDLVVHFAAESHVDRSIFNFGDFIRTNIEGTRVILEAVKRYKVPQTIHISTDEVYGNVPEGLSTEGSPLNPSSPYAASKTAGDMLARTYATIYGIPLAIVRSSNNYGTFQYPEKLIPLTITNLLNDEKIPVHGEGQHIRSWLHVEDFCDAVDRIAHSNFDFSIYNLTGEHRSNLQVIEQIANCLDKNHLDYIEHVHDRPSADLRYAPDASKIKKELGWEATHEFSDSLGAVVDWYKNNEKWWKDIRSKGEFLDHYEKQSKARWY
ncbi:dTDP-glucose 4,6-dehydratase [Patescibacteria group bacterium]|nr:dTDP-glucose 4,6-dehydratase [Patescibacteria group bacterium]MBU1501117.1 dTDP-glucose 4,6-dehydratase [Patescibacteria group bacterium]MBU2081010.1 dTDP-glucose 4,6-dehydratase [Patescibacteria group bacterium]MBU2124102.1 dTDP-glucose 4,6-dehydratase [Patescibacteria group bacterium]MBU2194957.1 dTDP-glucose 4,6-dehydratase [Patescibacteria group bacterium]